jgi:hypothetical protein
MSGIYVGPGSLWSVAGRWMEYRLDFMGVQEVRWAKGGTEPAEDPKILFENGNKNHWKVVGYFNT